MPMHYTVKNGIEYNSDTADILHYRDTWYGYRRVLALTPDGHYFEAMIGSIFGWQVFPLSRLRAVEWALANKAPDRVLERLGVTVMATPNVPADKPYEDLLVCEFLHAKKKLFKNDVLYTIEALCQNPPDGRFFLYDGMRVLRLFLNEDFIPMTQREALLWGIKYMAPWESLEIMGYKRSLPENPRDDTTSGSQAGGG